MNWSEKIKVILESGMTQTAVAKEVGYSTTWVRKVLSGEISDVSWASGQALIKMERRARRKMQLQ